MTLNTCPPLPKVLCCTEALPVTATISALAPCVMTALRIFSQMYAQAPALKCHAEEVAPNVDLELLQFLLNVLDLWLQQLVIQTKDGAIEIDLELV